MLKKAPVSRWALFIDWGNPHVQQKTSHGFPWLVLFLGEDEKG